MQRTSGFSARLEDRVGDNAVHPSAAALAIAGGPACPQASRAPRPLRDHASPPTCAPGSPIAASAAPVSGLHSPVSHLPDLAARFSIAWLVAANLAGLLLATLLLWPNVGDTLAPLTYGRWMPVHHNAQLYGWCALPLVGLLLRAFLVPGRAADRHTLIVLGTWSAALAFGAFSWLRGEASGKLFLDWAGPARLAFPAALCALWAVLAHHAFRHLAEARNSTLSSHSACRVGPRIRTGSRADGASAGDGPPPPAEGSQSERPSDRSNRSVVQSSAFEVQCSMFAPVPPASIAHPPSPIIHLLRFALVAALLLVPAVMHFSAGPRTFPPVNPDSGGATGVSLYGSTLGLILVFAAVPWMVALPLRPGARRSRLTGPVLGAALVVFGFANHGHGSHHDRDQIVTLALLFLAPPVLARDWRRFVWKPEARGWLIAALVWGALLVADGWITFLPAFSERLKFTNALVAHSHLAMAGLLTSINMVFLLHLGDSPRVAAALGARAPFRLWQLAATLHIGLLLALGWFEGATPDLVLGGGATVRLAYTVRLLAGAAMTVASIWWLIGLLRSSPSSSSASADAH